MPNATTTQSTSAIVTQNITKASGSAGSESPYGAGKRNETASIGRQRSAAFEQRMAAFLVNHIKYKSTGRAS